MNIRKQIKQNARRALGGNWGKGICIFIITLSIFAIFSLLQSLSSLLLKVPDFQDIMATPRLYLDDIWNLSGISLLLSAIFVAISLIINSPLSFGVEQWHYHLVGGQADDISGIFSFFDAPRLFFKTIWYNLNLGIRLAFWNFCFSLPAGGVCAAALLLLREAPSATGALRLGGILLLLLGGALFLLGQAFFLVFRNRYFIASYLIIDRPELGVFKALRLSRRYTKGFRWDILMFQLSFLPWALLSVLVLPLLYVVPYYSASRALYAKYLIERGKLQEPEDATVAFDLNGQNITQENTAPEEQA